MKKFYTKEELGVLGIRELITIWEGEMGEDFFDYCCFSTPVEEFIKYLKKIDSTLAEYIEENIKEENPMSVDMQLAAYYCCKYHEETNNVNEDSSIDHIVKAYEESLIPVCKFIYENETMWKDFEEFFTDKNEYYDNISQIEIHDVKKNIDKYLESRETSIAESILSELSQFNNEVEEAKKNFADTIFKHTDSGKISKIRAIEWLTYYEILPINSWTDMPEWMEDSGEFERYSTVQFYDYLENEDNFKLEDGTVEKYTPFPHTTLEEAINKTYDFIKKHRIIGCIFDW